MTAEMTAEGLPLAPEAVDGEPTTEGTPEAEQSRRRKKALLLLLLGLLAMLITIAIWYLLFRQPISPLPPIPETQIPGYTTSMYGATRPTGVAVSPSGDRIYVTQSGGDRTSLVFDAAGTKLATMAPPEATGTNHVPVYAAVDPLTEEVYVSDRPMGTVYIYNRDGLFQRELALAEPRPGWQPMALAFDAAGLLYVTDLSGPYQKVLVIDRTANVVRTVGENESLNFPNGVGVDTAGNVYVTDSNNGRLLAFDGRGRSSPRSAVARAGATLACRAVSGSTAAAPLRGRHERSRNVHLQGGKRRHPPPRVPRGIRRGGSRRRPVRVSHRRCDRRARPRVRGGHVQRPRADLELLRLLAGQQGGEPGKTFAAGCGGPLTNTRRA